MSLRDLERELYGQKERTQRGQTNIPKPPQESDATTAPQGPWEKQADREQERTGHVLFGKLGKYTKPVMITLIVVLTASIGFAAFYVYQFLTTRDIDVVLDAPGEVLAGVPFSVAIMFENTSRRALEEPVMSITLPDGVIDVNAPDKRVVAFEEPAIAPGEIIKHEATLVVIGKTPLTYQLEARASYSYEASQFSSRFEKNAEASVLAKDPVIKFDFSAPSNVLNGEDFEVHLRYQNVGDTTIRDVRMQFSVPPIFVLGNADPKLEAMALAIPEFEPGSEYVAIFSGSVVGTERTFFELGAKAQIKLGDRYYDITSATASVTITPSPLSIAIALRGSHEAVQPDQLLDWQLSFVNNAGTAVSDVVIKAYLKGSMFDFGRIRSTGYFNDREHSITWTAASEAVLKALDVGQSGTIGFTVPVAKEYPVRALSDKNFTLKLRAEISSPTVPHAVTAAQTVGVAEVEYKVAGTLKFSEKAYFLEPSADIANQGQLPPRVGQTVQYTVHWDLAALGADFTAIQARAFLGPGVRWTGKVTANVSDVPVYNERTQEVVWDIKTLQAGRGVLTAGPQLIFQVEHTPSVNEISSNFVLVQNTTVSGIDTFSGLTTTSTARGLTSSNLSDAFLPDKFDKVQP